MCPRVCVCVLCFRPVNPLFIHTSFHTKIKTINCVCVCVLMCTCVWICQPHRLKSWRLQRWSHQAAAGMALAELRQCFRYEPRRCCHQGRSYEAPSVWRTSSSYCVGWSPPHPPPFTNSSMWSWDRKPSCFQTVWLRWLPHKQPIETSESSLRSGLFELTFWTCKTEKKNYHPYIIVQLWTPRREWKLWELDRIEIYSIRLLHSLYWRSVWRGTYLKIEKYPTWKMMVSTVGCYLSC